MPSKRHCLTLGTLSTLIQHLSQVESGTGSRIGLYVFQGCGYTWTMDKLARCLKSAKCGKAADLYGMTMEAVKLLLHTKSVNTLLVY